MVQTKKPNEADLELLTMKNLSSQTRAILGMFECKDELKFMPLEAQKQLREYKTTVINDVVNGAHIHRLLTDAEKSDALEHLTKLLDNTTDFDSALDSSKGLERVFCLIDRQIIEFTVDNQGRTSIVINQPMKFFIDTLRTMPKSTIKAVFSHIVTNMFEMGALARSEKDEALSYVEIFGNNPKRTVENIGKLKKVFDFINEGNVFVGRNGGKTLVGFEERMSTMVRK